MKKIAILSAVVLAVLLTGYIAANRGQGKPDDILIRELILRGEQSIDGKDMKTAVSCISPSYRSQPGGNFDGIRLLIAQGFRSEMRFDSQVSLPDIRVNGDNALAASKITIYNVANNNRDMLFSKNLTLVLLKEPVKRYWIYPVKEWKITGIQGLEFMSGGEGM